MIPRTYRLSAETEKRIEEVRQTHGGISAQAAVTLIIARGLRALDDDQATVTAGKAPRNSGRYKP